MHLLAGICPSSIPLFPSPLFFSLLLGLFRPLGVIQATLLPAFLGPSPPAVIRSVVVGLWRDEGGLLWPLGETGKNSEGMGIHLAWLGL